MRMPVYEIKKSRKEAHLEKWVLRVATHKAT